MNQVITNSLKKLQTDGRLIIKPTNNNDIIDFISNFSESWGGGGISDCITLLNCGVNINVLLLLYFGEYPVWKIFNHRLQNYCDL